MAVAKSGGGKKPSARAVPKLSFAGPLAMGLAVSGLFFAMVIGIGGSYQVPRFVNLDAKLRIDDQVSAVYAQARGRRVHYYAAAGTHVEAGALVARLDNSALDKRIASLTSQAAAARWRLRVIQEKVGAAMRSPNAAGIEMSREIIAMTKQTNRVEKIALELMQRVASAQRALLDAEIRTRVAGRVEMPAPGGDRHQVAAGHVREGRQLVLNIVQRPQYLKVSARLPLTTGNDFKPGAKAKVILFDVTGQRHGPWPAVLRETGDVATPMAGETRSGRLVFEITAARLQIAKHIELYSGLKASVLVEAGEQTFLRAALPLS